MPKYESSVTVISAKKKRVVKTNYVSTFVGQKLSEFLFEVHDIYVRVGGNDIACM